MNQVKRAIVFVHYDRDDMVDDYLYYYLKELGKNASHLVFVSTSKLSNRDIDILSTYCDKVIIRDNVGYDFMSYKVGLESFKYRDYDELVICNDSVYGPLYPLEELFSSMQNKKCDFWGITDNTEIGYHLQSYFLVVNKNVISSSVFKKFWEDVRILNDKNKIIQKYEIGFTQLLIEYGFTPSVCTSFSPTFMQKLSVFKNKFTPMKIIKKITSILSGKSTLSYINKINITHFFWKELLSHGNVPFIKIELLRDNPMKVDINDFEKTIQEISSYDTQLITNHLSRIKKKRINDA